METSNKAYLWPVGARAQQQLALCAGHGEAELCPPGSPAQCTCWHRRLGSLVQIMLERLSPNQYLPRFGHPKMTLLWEQGRHQRASCLPCWWAAPTPLLSMASPVVYVQHRGPGRHHLDNLLDKTLPPLIPLFVIVLSFHCCPLELLLLLAVPILRLLRLRSE